jgi:hypothetical protein
VLKKEKIEARMKTPSLSLPGHLVAMICYISLAKGEVKMLKLMFE